MRRRRRSSAGDAIRLASRVWVCPHCGHRLRAASTDRWRGERDWPMVITTTTCDVCLIHVTETQVLGLMGATA